MSFNGSGTFVINTAGQPVVSGTVISSTAFNALTADLATGLSTAITKDGQTTVTANIPFGNNKITGLGAGTAAADAANLSQVQSTVAKLINSVSGADTITGTMSPNLAAYATGQMFYFVAAGANTGAVTINIDSLGAKNITRDGTTALAAGDIQSGEICVIVYDGTQFQLVNGASQSASIVTENLTVNKATVLNESGGDNDTRIEGDTDANLFFVDASTDNVGIGTNTPADKFHVVGRIRGTADSTTSNTNAYGFAFSTATNTDRVLWGGYDNSLNAGFIQATELNIKHTDLILNPNGGNLGLGVTPSAWGSSNKAFQISGGGAVWSPGTADTRLSNNQYRDASNARIYIANGAAHEYVQNSSGHAWLTAPSGTAGNTITFTEAMTLDANGRLGIGITSPSYPLHVRTDATGTDTWIGSQNATATTTTGAGFIAVAGSSTYYSTFKQRANGDAELFQGNATGSLLFGTNNTERARITSGGFFKASNNGTYFNSTASYHEFLQSGDTRIIQLTNTASSLTDTVTGINMEYSAASPNNTSAQFLRFTDNAGGGTVRFVVYSNGGIANFQGNDSNLSDERVKTDIAPLGSMWDKFKAIEIVTFKYKDQTHDDDNIGVIAQQVESVAPEFIDVDGFGETPEDGVPLKTVYTTDLYHAAIKALQEAMTRIEQLEAEVKAMKEAAP